MNDDISKAIVDFVSQNVEPLGTKEIEKAVSEKLKGSTRAKIIYRLMNLRAEGKIQGKNIVSSEGKGLWIWWRIDAFD